MEKIWLYAKDPYEAKYQFLINKSESMGYIIFLMILKLLLNTQVTDDVCKNIEEYNPNKKCKILTFLMMWLLVCLVIKNLNQ